MGLRLGYVLLHGWIQIVTLVLLLVGLPLLLISRVSERLLDLLTAIDTRLNDRARSVRARIKARAEASSQGATTEA